MNNFSKLTLDLHLNWIPGPQHRSFLGHSVVFLNLGTHPRILLSFNMMHGCPLLNPNPCSRLSLRIRLICRRVSRTHDDRTQSPKPVTLSNPHASLSVIFLFLHRLFLDLSSLAYPVNSDSPSNLWSTQQTLQHLFIANQKVDIRVKVINIPFHQILGRLLLEPAWVWIKCGFWSAKIESSSTRRKELTGNISKEWSFPEIRRVLRVETRVVEVDESDGDEDGEAPKDKKEDEWEDWKYGWIWERAVTNCIRKAPCRTRFHRSSSVHVGQRCNIRQFETTRSQLTFWLKPSTSD